MLFASCLPEQLSQVAALFPLLSFLQLSCRTNLCAECCKGQQEGTPLLRIIREQRKACSFSTLDLGHKELSKCGKHTPWLGV